MTRPLITAWFAAGGLTVVVGALLSAAEPTKQRARPPKFTQETMDAFFPDARERLVGNRPASAASASSTPTANASAANNHATGTPARFSWAKLASAETLATEVKRLAAELRQPLAAPTRFNAEARRQCQNHFSLLAILFAVIAEYDGDVRWKTEAPNLRDAMALAAAHCKQSGDKSFAEAKARAADLDEVVRGGRLAAANARPLNDRPWSDLAERAPLMQRLQLAHQDRIRPHLADARQFSKSAADVQHEAEMLALVAQVIRRPQYEYSDDETFIEYADELQSAAQALARAAATQDYDAARAAAAQAGQACTNCHQGYRL